VTAEAAVEGQEEGFPCPECDRVLSTRPAMLAHIAFKHRGVKLGGAGKSKPAGKAPAPATRERKPAPLPTEAEVKVEIGKAVANLKTAGGFLSIVAPHTGIAIAGVVSEPSREFPAGQIIVNSRADRAGRILEGWALRDYRVLEAVRRFNAIFEGSDAASLAAELGAAVAVDVRLADPHMALEVGPFRGENAIKPVEALIGDVVAYVDANSEPEPERPPRVVESMPGGGETISGGIENT
jgi:hypothetical protein